MLSRLNLKTAFIITLLFASSGIYATEVLERSYVSFDNQELGYQHFPAAKEREQDTVMIWVAPGYGLNPRHYKLAPAVSKAGFEVWMIDYANSLFMPHGTTTMRELDARHVSAIIKAAHKVTGKKVVLLSHSYGAIPVLKGIREWQLEAINDPLMSKANYLIGAILFSPDLYATIPSLGLAPVYEPIVSATNKPVVIFQGAKRNTRWQLKYVRKELALGGSQVYVKLQKGVTAVFYHGDEAAATEARLKELPDEFHSVVKLLKRSKNPVEPAALKTKTIKAKRLDDKIKLYRGNPEPPAIDLLDANGKRYIRKNYIGKVTVVNFWATWCPPCVEEIPSLNRLRDKMKDEPFELISINYAESKESIQAFLKRVDVDFPVLLDETGEVSSSQWNVLVFPSTFVIGTDGKIHYGVNAAIEWDSDEVIKKLKTLY